MDPQADVFVTEISPSLIPFTAPQLMNLVDNEIQAS
jgi:hypothetical protein